MPLTQPLSCALCGASTTQWEVIKTIPIDECTQCRHRQARLSIDEAHVTEVYGDDYFTGGGSGYVDYLAEGPMLVKRGLKYARILNRSTPPGRLIDIGAAAGFLLEGMCQAGWTGTGVEPNDTMASQGRARGFDIRTGSFDGLTDEALLPATGHRIARNLDAITMIQVIAHLSDPAAAVAHAARLLRPGGLLLIETWDRASKAARIAGKGWHEYSPPSVVHWFTRKELDDLAHRANLTRIDTGRMPKWITAEHATSLLHHGNPTGKAAAMAKRIPPRLALPYPGDDLFWVVYQRTA
jgi:2-polyprenyl-3-methyl-5-hydroxy-6-metoxy-1,4-benzoquinol methylase